MSRQSQSYPQILNSLLCEDACEMIYNRIVSDIDNNYDMTINEEYMKNVFLDPGEYTLSQFEDLHSKDRDEAFEEYASLAFIRSCVNEENGVDKVINMGLNFMRSYSNYYEKESPEEESTYKLIIKRINKDGIYAV